MLSWFRRWPAYAVNGLSVSVGVGLVQLLVGVFASAAFAQAATVGAVLASLPHLTGRAVPMWRRSLLGGLLAAFATLLMLLLAEHSVLRGLVLAQIVFVALMGMAWGKRTGSLVFSVIIGVIFALARPSSPAELPSVVAAGLCGVVLYSCWAFLNAKLLEPRYRTLAVFRTIEAASALLRARAAVLSHAAAEDEDDARFAQMTEETNLAEALQIARDLVFSAPGGGGALHVALISSVAELREIVLTSRLDLDLLGHDHAARFVRARLALGLKRLGLALAQLARSQSEGVSALKPEHFALDLPDMTEAAPLLADDARARLLPPIATRLRYLSEEIEHIRRLLQGVSERSSLRPEELTQFISDDDTWPLSAVGEHLSLSSPVLRHAARSALAMLSVYFLAYALPWTTRPYWMLLSVAVVLRGTLDDTLTRRNARVLGTAIGCVLVTVMVPLVPTPWLKLVFVGAVGVGHAFVNVRYRLTAIAATVMALLQAQFAAPGFSPLVLERLLDTLLGGLFAWAFSYVLPSWERRSLPVAVEHALGALRAYSHSALQLDGSARPLQRLERQRAYDALAVIAAAVQRSAAEPQSVRPPVKPLVSALDHAQQLMAHLSSLRSLLVRRASHLPPGETDEALAAARQAIAAHLSLPGVVSTTEASAETATEAPRTTVDESPLPWLLRRLEAARHDANATGRAAREALSQLARPTA
jgi:MFS family permease